MTITADRAEEAAERRLVFVKLPHTIDISNDRIVLDSLAAALAGSSSVVIADATGTAWCDCAGISALVCAHRQAAAAGAQLRVVAASAAVQRIVKLTGAQDVLNIYLTVDDALADMTGPQRHASAAVTG